MATVKAGTAPGKQPQPKDEGNPKLLTDDEDKETKKKKKAVSKYNYSFGDNYPGIAIGHKYCNPFMIPGYPVPPNMGWDWKNPDFCGLKPRRGWQPGLIGKSVARLMTFKCPRGSKAHKKKKRRGIGGPIEGGDSEPDEPLQPKAALKIHRKGDVYTIEVNPLKDLTVIHPNEDPYVNCDPIVFKITRQRTPEERAKVEARRLIKLKRERDAEIRKALAEAVEDICKCAYMDVYCNDLTAIDQVIQACPAFQPPPCVCKEESLSSLSSNASWDIEYTPPFGCFDLNTPRKTLLFIHVETQYDLADIGITECPPKPCRKPCANPCCKTCKPCRKSCYNPCCKPCYKPCCNPCFKPCYTYKPCSKKSCSSMKSCKTCKTCKTKCRPSKSAYYSRYCRCR